MQGQRWSVTLHRYEPRAQVCPAQGRRGARVTMGPLKTRYLGAHPDATTGLDLCRFFETRPNEWFTHAQLKARLGCSDRIIREHVPEGLNGVLPFLWAWEDLNTMTDYDGVTLTDFGQRVVDHLDPIAG